MAPPHLIEIPAGTKPSHCSSCGAVIYWANHPMTGRPHPISIGHVAAYEPREDSDGRGISHFADCKFADQHRRARVPVKEPKDAAPIPEALDREAAELVPLIGDSTKWDGYGSKPLGVVPDKVLRIARRWLAQKVKETPDARLARQIAAITVVLDHREANSPQQSLGL